MTSIDRVSTPPSSSPSTSPSPSNAAPAPSRAPAPARAGRYQVPSLRTALLLDAVVTGANGAAYLAAATWLDGLLGISSAPLRAIGAFLVAFGVAVAVVGARPHVAPRAVVAVIVLNALWVVESVVAAATGWQSPTTVGVTWMILQAGVVAAFAALQTVAARRRDR